MSSKLTQSLAMSAGTMDEAVCERVLIHLLLGVFEMGLNISAFSPESAGALLMGVS